MYGWNGKLLYVNLSKSKAVAKPYDAIFAKNFLGGRGFAAKILWDELKPGIDPLSPENKLVLAVGPLTGFALPSSGKMVVASKSPLTGSYGDGNIGTYAALQIRKAGYDAVIVEGKAKKPIILLIQDAHAEFLDAQDLWGITSLKLKEDLRNLRIYCWHLMHWS